MYNQLNVQIKQLIEPNYLKLNKTINDSPSTGHNKKKTINDFNFLFVVLNLYTINFYYLLGIATFLNIKIFIRLLNIYIF